MYCLWSPLIAEERSRVQCWSPSTSPPRVKHLGQVHHHHHHHKYFSTVDKNFQRNFNIIKIIGKPKSIILSLQKFLSKAALSKNIIAEPSKEIWNNLCSRCFYLDDLHPGDWTSVTVPQCPPHSVSWPVSSVPCWNKNHSSWSRDWHLWQRHLRHHQSEEDVWS